MTKIAVIGPSADDPIGLLGNYNGISSKQVTPLEGIKQQFAKAKVQYALGATYTAATPALVDSSFLSPPDGKGEGLLAEYFDNPDFQGEPKLRRWSRACTSMPTWKSPPWWRPSMATNTPSAGPAL